MGYMADIPGTTKFFVGTYESVIFLYDVSSPTSNSIPSISVSSLYILKLDYVPSADILLAIAFDKKCYKF